MDDEHAYIFVCYQCCKQLNATHSCGTDNAQRTLDVQNTLAFVNVNDKSRTSQCTAPLLN
eukprot:1160261-Pelagomonas_calceolata.AAC.15